MVSMRPRTIRAHVTEPQTAQAIIQSPYCERNEVMGNPRNARAATRGSIPQGATETAGEATRNVPHGSSFPRHDIRAARRAVHRVPLNEPAAARAVSTDRRALMQPRTHRPTRVHISGPSRGYIGTCVRISFKCVFYGVL